jgi:hypothetical protein
MKIFTASYRLDHSGGVDVQVLGRPHATRYMDRLFKRDHVQGLVRHDYDRMVPARARNPHLIVADRNAFLRRIIAKRRVYITRLAPGKRSGVRLTLPAKLGSVETARGGGRLQQPPAVAPSSLQLGRDLRHMSPLESRAGKFVFRWHATTVGLGNRRGHNAPRIQHAKPESKKSCQKNN